MRLTDTTALVVPPWDCFMRPAGGAASMTNLNQIAEGIERERADGKRRRKAAGLAPWQVGAVLLAGAGACFAAGAAFARWALGW